MALNRVGLGYNALNGTEYIVSVIYECCYNRAVL
jgi:hypothetical protein